MNRKEMKITAITAVIIVAAILVMVSPYRNALLPLIIGVSLVHATYILVDFKQPRTGTKKLLFVFVLPMVLTAVLPLGWKLGGYEKMADTVTYSGPGLVCLFALLYVGWDSRSKWPNDSFMTRIDNVLRLKR